MHNPLSLQRNLWFAPIAPHCAPLRQPHCATFRHARSDKAVREHRSPYFSDLWSVAVLCGFSHPVEKNPGAGVSPLTVPLRA